MTAFAQGILALTLLGCATARPALEPSGPIRWTARHPTLVATRECPDVEPEDRDQSPFDHIEDILWVSALKSARPGFPAHVPHTQVVGAAIAFKSVEGLSAQRLQRIVDCHLERSDLLPRGVQARVVTDGGQLVVELLADLPSTARALLARARLLTPGVSL